MKLHGCFRSSPNSFPQSLLIKLSHFKNIFKRIFKKIIFFLYFKLIYIYIYIYLIIQVLEMKVGLYFLKLLPFLVTFSGPTQCLPLVMGLFKEGNAHDVALTGRMDSVYRFFPSTCLSNFTRNSEISTSII